MLRYISTSIKLINILIITLVKALNTSRMIFPLTDHAFIDAKIR